MMKLRISSRYLLNYPNCHRTILSYTLHCRHNNSILISISYLPRRKLRLTYPLHTCQWGLNILYLPFHSYRTRYLLRILYLYRNMKHRSNPFIHCNSYCIYRLRPSMRTNILLRSHSHYQSSLSNSIYRTNNCRMNLRRVFRRQSNPNTILRISLYPTIYHRSLSFSPPFIFT